MNYKFSIRGPRFHGVVAFRAKNYESALKRLSKQMVQLKSTPFKILSCERFIPLKIDFKPFIFPAIKRISPSLIAKDLIC